MNKIKATFGYVALIVLVLWCSVFDRNKLEDLIP
jgi:hypothetical protein